MSRRVNVSIENHVAVVRMDRADKLNALDLEMFEALSAAADQLSNEPGVRVVVLHGAGGNFCAGIDLSVLADEKLDIATALSTPQAPSPANFFQRAAYAWRELPMPVICAIEGVAFGGGLQIALAADVRIAAPDASLSIMEATWGIIPDMGLSTTLRGLVAPDKVKELAWTGRVVGGDEAHAIGLVSEIAHEPLAVAKKLAERCANVSPDAVRGIKSLVNQAWQMSEADALALEAKLQGDVIGGTNQREAVAANLAKRRAKFTDPV